MLLPPLTTSSLGSRAIQELPERLWILVVVMNERDEPLVLADAVQQVTRGRLGGEEELPLCPNGKGFVLCGSKCQ